MGRICGNKFTKDNFSGSKGDPVHVPRSSCLTGGGKDRSGTGERMVNLGGGTCFIVLHGGKSTPNHIPVQT